MVDGVHGHVMGHAVRHVVVEHKGGLEGVIILHLSVKETIVRAMISKGNHVILVIAVLVRLCNIISCVYVCMVEKIVYCEYMYVQYYVYDVYVCHYVLL